MKHMILSLLGAMVVTGVLAEGHIEGHATRAAISALYVAGDDAQRAIAIDVCQDVGLLDTTAAGDALRGDAARQYKHLREALQAAYDAVTPTDGELEAVRHQYCEWAGER